MSIENDLDERFFYNIFNENLYQHHKSIDEQNGSWEVVICLCLGTMKKPLVALVIK